MSSSDYTEDNLVQRTTAEYLEKELRLEGIILEGLSWDIQQLEQAIRWMSQIYGCPQIFVAKQAVDFCRRRRSRRQSLLRHRRRCHNCLHRPRSLSPSRTTACRLSRSTRS